MSKRKSYNPFKLWGSYLGLILGGSFGILAALGIVKAIESIAPEGAGPIPMGFTSDFLIQMFPGILISAVIGFLLGYGIHALIRRLR